MWILTCNHELAQSDGFELVTLNSKYVSDASAVTGERCVYDVVAFTSLCNDTKILLARDLSRDEAEAFLLTFASATCENRSFATVGEIIKRVKTRLLRQSNSLAESGE